MYQAEYLQPFLPLIADKIKEKIPVGTFSYNYHDVFLHDPLYKKAHA